MNAVEAAKAVAMLATSYPGATFPEESAAAYEGFLCELNYPEVVTAIRELVLSQKFMPAVSEIRAEVFRARKVARDKAQVPELPAPPLEKGPRPEVWGRKLGEMLDDSDRYRRMAEAWYRSKGKAYPGDPGKPLIEVCQAGARGEDVREGFRKVVIPTTPEAIEEAEELERRFP